jgi:hypothetical protein
MIENLIKFIFYLPFVLIVWLILLVVLVMAIPFIYAISGLCILWILFELAYELTRDISFKKRK